MSGARELLLLAVLYLGYAVGRTFSDDTLGPAQQVGQQLLQLEGAVGLDVEQTISSWTAAHTPVAVLACWLYAVMHYTVTPAVLFWLFRRHPDFYRADRTVLVVGTVIGLVVFTLVPTAPPRLLPGFVDVMADYSSYGWWSTAGSVPEGLSGLTNQLAALPSLHVGWAAWCGWVVCRHARTTAWRTAALLYPVLTAVVVVATANHYLLDVAAGLAVMAVAAALVRRHCAERQHSP